MATLANLTVSSGGYLALPSGNTSQRPSSPAAGMLRYNTTNNQSEGYTGSYWADNGLLTTNLILHLDASNLSSYPGSGTVWYDLSGNSNNFNILSTAWNSAGHMDFRGSYGMAKNSADITLSGDVTYVVIGRPRDGTADWRTLTRSYVSDHHVIFEDGSYRMGMYDNDAAGFIDSGLRQNTLPNYSTKGFELFVWRWTNSDNPTYELTINGGQQRGSITNSNARYNRGFGSIGGYHNGNTDPSSGSQAWGEIRLFAAYNARLSDAQIAQIYNQLKARIG